MAPLVTAEHLRQVLDYDQETGKFFWKAPRSNVVKIGDEAGCVNHYGYHVISIACRYYRANRLAWLYVYGEWPKNYVDHINGVRLDNRIANLRDVPAKVNAENRKGPQKDNKVGVLGVSKKRKRWAARVKTEGKTKHLGCFDTPEEAHQAYLSAKRQIHVGCTI